MQEQSEKRFIAGNHLDRREWLGNTACFGSAVLAAQGLSAAEAPGGGKRLRKWAARGPQSATR